MWGYAVAFVSATLTVLALLGALPLLAACWQYARIGCSPRHCHLDRAEPYLPRVAVLIPAWNEGAVLGTSVRRLLALDYPRDRLRVYVVDDASTDATPDIARELETQYPGSVRHLRREQGGQGKAHTLNHGLAVLAEENWARAVLITDADVIFTPLSLRRMTRHLADPSIGAVTAYIREGTRDKNYLNRFVAYEYATAQAAARRSQNVAGALACLAGGAQLHTMDNITALGGTIDTSTLAEDTITTFETQLNGRRVLFEGNAIALAEEPRAIGGLWKQRLRWARGNVDVTRRYRRLWFRRSPDHRLGAPMFGLLWFCLLLQPALMIVGSVSMVGLFFLAPDLSWQVFQKLWIVNALGYTFITAMTLLLDRRTARSSWRQALLFPGLVSLLVIVWAVFPPVFDAMLGEGAGRTGGPLLTAVVLFSYVWLAGCMAVAYLARRVENTRAGFLAPALVYLSGYGALLCAVTVASYWAHLRAAPRTWDKTEKVGAHTADAAGAGKLVSA